MTFLFRVLFFYQLLACSFKSELLDTFSVGDFIKVAFTFSKMESYIAVDMKWLVQYMHWFMKLHKVCWFFITLPMNYFL